MSFETYVSHSLMTLSIGIYDVREEMCATPSSSGFAQFFFQVSPHLLTIVTAHHFCPFGKWGQVKYEVAFELYAIKIILVFFRDLSIFC